MWWLSIVWWLAALAGTACVIVAVTRRQVRAAGLWFAAGSFLVAGLLGLASIGMVFLVGAVVCAVVAVKAAPSPPTS